MVYFLMVPADQHISETVLVEMNGSKIGKDSESKVQGD